MTKGGGRGKGRPRKVIPIQKELLPPEVDVAESSHAAEMRRCGSIAVIDEGGSA